MVQTAFNIFDLGVVIILLLSGLLSFYRGFLREVMSLGSWIGASVIALYAFPSVSAWLKPQVKSDMAAAGLASIGVFFIALVFISIISGMFLKYLKPSGEIGFFDNLVGLAFGVARGVLLIAIAYLVMDKILTEKNFPDWVKEARTREYVAEAAQTLEKIAPNYLAEMTGEKTEESDTPTEEEKPGNRFDPITIKRGPEKSDKPNLGLPTMEELQQRIREENEKNHVR